MVFMQFPPRKWLFRNRFFRYAIGGDMHRHCQRAVPYVRGYHFGDFQTVFGKLIDIRQQALHLPKLHISRHLPLYDLVYTQITLAKKKIPADMQGFS